MTQDPNSQLPLVAKMPRTPESVTSTVSRYVMAFVRISFWLVVAVATGALVYLGIRAVVWAVTLVSDALGMQP